MFLPAFEGLERVTLLAVSITGTVWSDPTAGGGARPPGVPGVAGETVVVDLGHDHSGQLATTLAAPSTTLTPATGQLGGVVKNAGVSTLNVQGLAGTVTALKVTMDLTNTGAAPVIVALASPVGQTVPNLPTLFEVQPGEHFIGSFDPGATTPITLAPDLPLTTGTYVPQQSFSDPQAHVDGTDPNGGWALVFVGDTSHLVLSSWSLTITTPDPTTQTDANGNYAFTGLAAGTYQVETLPAPGDTQTSPAGGAARTVTLADGQTAAGVDFGVQAASALTAQSFYLSAPAAGWGQDVTINYTLANQGNGAAPAFDVAVVLSTGAVAPGGPVLQTLHFGGLGAHTTTTGAVTVTLPNAAPAGFGPVTQSYVGFLIDPAHALALNAPAGASGHGLGVDEAALAVAPNQAVAAGAGVQQMPDIAVDPNDSNHLVVADMDNTLVSTGYAGIGVSTSFDGGATWTHSAVPLPAGFNQGAATPTVQFDGKGGVLVSFMAATFLGPKPGLTNPASTQRLDGFSSNNGVFVARSGDGGLTWGSPVAVASHTFAGALVPFDISPDFAADTFKALPDGKPNPNFGNLYVTWARVYPPGQFPGDPASTAGTDIMISVSHDGGLTWATQMQTEPGTGLKVSAIKDPAFGSNGTGGEGHGFVFYPQISVGPEGDLYVSAYSGGYFAVFHSTDAGASFRAPDYNNQLGLPFGTTVLPSPLFADQFRTNPVRDIVADPSHPGRVYVVEATAVNNAVVGGVIDSGQIIFAVSNDYGLTWEDQFQVGNEATNLASLPPGKSDLFLSVLNDDDGGRDTAFDTATQLNQEVISAQALPSLAVDASGNITVIWYDTRRDPSQQNLDVFGTVSRDGGKTFSPNFRVSDTTFNPNAGAFLDANGRPDGYMGDRISVAASNGTAYAVWTDTRNGSQDVELQKYSLALPPQAPLDRFYPNNTPSTATALGEVIAEQLPMLVAAPADDNWFNLQAGASGTLDVDATVTSGDASNLQVELTDANGNVLPAVSTPVLNASGAVVGRHLVFPGVALQTYLVHVSGGGSTVGYSLALGSLTADLGTSVQGVAAGSIIPGGQSVDRLTAAVTGSLALALTPASDASGGLVLQVLSADGQTLLASGPTINLPVTQGQVVLLQVSGAGAQAGGHFSLAYTNLDQYETPGAGSLFLPTTGDPSSVAVADLNGDGTPDIFVSSTAVTDPVNVLLGNPDGTYQSPHQYNIGPGLSGALTAGSRQVGVADINGDGVPDVLVPNFRAGDISVLLGDSGGTLQPEPRFDAVASPDSLVTADFNGDGKADVAVLQNFAQLGGHSTLAVLDGRGDGTFKPATTYQTIFTDGAGPMVVGDFNGDGHEDIIVFSKNDPEGEMFLGQGDGTFTAGPVFQTGENVFAAEAVDLGDGKLSLITTGTNSGNVYVMRGNGDGTFGPATAYTAMTPAPGDNVGVDGLAVVGFKSTVSGSVPVSPTGAVAGTPGIYVTAQARSGLGPGAVLFLPATFDKHGQFSGFGTAVLQATLGAAGEIVAFDRGGVTDLVATDAGGVRVVEAVPQSGAGGSALPVPANTTPATARDLGSVTHLVTLPQAVVSGHEDAYYTYTVPSEDVAGAGPQVVNVSSLFQNVAGAGLSTVVTDASGRVLATGDRVRVVAAQGAVLTIHVSGLTAAGQPQGTGVYTLDVDTLPQVYSITPLSVTPGGAVDSLSITFQGDNLDPLTAQDPANYTVTYLGPGGPQVVPIASRGGGQPVVYNPAVNVQVTSGLSYATAERQTVTLLFDRPLAPGSYRVTLSPALQAQPFTPGEAATLAGGAGFAGHPVVSLVNGGAVVSGAVVDAPALVPAPVTTAGVGSIAQGSPFLTQLQADLVALLDAGLKAKGDDPAISAQINAQILSRFAALFGGQGAGAPKFTILWLDPVSIDLQSAHGPSLTYDLSSNALSNGLGSTYVSVGGNVELIVMENAAGTFNLDVANVPSSARGGEVQVSASGISSEEFTAALRGGENSFSVNTGEGEGGAVAAGGGLTTAAFALVSAFLVGTPFAPGGTSGGALSESSAEAEAAGAAVAGGATTAVTQPISTSVLQGKSSGVGQELTDQPDDSGLAAWLASPRGVVQVVKNVAARFNQAIGAVGGKQGPQALRFWRELLNTLIHAADEAIGAKPNGKKAEQTPAGEKAPAALTVPAAPAAGEAASWDQGLDALLRERTGAGPASGSGPRAFWVAAFLAAGLPPSGLRDLARGGVTARDRGRRKAGRPD